MHYALYRSDVSLVLRRLIETGEAVRLSERDLRMLHVDNLPRWQFDRQILSQSWTYVFASGVIGAELSGRYGISVLPQTAIDHLLDQSYRAYEESLVWGFVGRAVHDERYDYEGEALETLFGSLSYCGVMPVLAVDRGMGMGAPAIAAAMAVNYEVPTLGILSHDQMAYAASRNNIVIQEDANRSAARALGYAVDVLVCVGGDADDLHALETTLSAGGVALVVYPRDAHREALIHGIQRSPTVQQAIQQGRVLFVESGLSAMSQTVEMIHGAALSTARQQRGIRLEYVRSLLDG